jgi:hypothetical protein
VAEAAAAAREGWAGGWQGGYGNGSKDNDDEFGHPFNNAFLHMRGYDSKGRIGPSS